MPTVYSTCSCSTNRLISHQNYDKDVTYNIHNKIMFSIFIDFNAICVCLI